MSTPAVSLRADQRGISIAPSMEPITQAEISSMSLQQDPQISLALNQAAARVPAMVQSAAAALETDPELTKQAIEAFLDIESHLEDDERVLRLLIDKAKNGRHISNEDLSQLKEIEQRKNRFILLDPRTNPKVDGNDVNIVRISPKASRIERLYNELAPILAYMKAMEGKADSKVDSKSDGKAASKAEVSVLRWDGVADSLRPWKSDLLFNQTELSMPVGCVCPWIPYCSKSGAISSDWTDHGETIGKEIGNYHWITHRYSRVVDFDNGRFKLIYTEVYTSDPSFKKRTQESKHKGPIWNLYQDWLTSKKFNA